MGASVGPVVSGTENLWDEFVLDSGSVSTACPCAWCSDISVNNKGKVHLQDIQSSRSPFFELCHPRSYPCPTLFDSISSFLFLP